MKVISMFDGIAGARQALHNLNINCEYYAYEIDKYAIQIAQKNFPSIKQMGDVYKASFLGFIDTDLLIGGSPCQGFSFAGKQLNFDDSRSNLFFEFVRVKNETKPKYFLLENVKMKKEYQDVISRHLGVEPIEINSALLTAQNRKRLYWTNIPNITQPEDKGIYLKDILENGDVDRLKSYCIDANYFKGGNLEQYFNKSRRHLVFLGGLEKNKKWVANNKELSRNYSQGERVYRSEGKSACLNSNSGGTGGKTGLYAIAQRGRNIVDGKRKNIKGAKTQQRFETSYLEKGNCLTTVQKDSLVLDTKDYIIRKLTPIECERLQGFPDNYTEGVSQTQRYKALGNSFTVPVIEHILNFIK